jgi:hypothetical protein
VVTGGRKREAAPGGEAMGEIGRREGKKLGRGVIDGSASDVGTVGG